MSDPGELDARETARTRRRDRDASAERRELLKPGMGKVFKQIQDAQRRAASEATRKPARKGTDPDPKDEGARPPRA
jgi:hypothetical protein